MSKSGAPLVLNDLAQAIYNFISLQFKKKLDEKIDSQFDFGLGLFMGPV